MDGTLSERLIGSDDERAVSPVIGVILMVAITVILAAVIAAFVMGIGPGDTSVNAGVDVESTNDTTATLTVTDGGNADYLAVVNGSGEIEMSFSATSGNSEQVTGLNNDSDFTIYAYQADSELSSGDSVDDSSSSSQIGTFSTDS